jgi:predicted DNA-binding transcriptional regulator YafY
MSKTELEPITKAQRWLDLISYLVGRRYGVEVGELMEQLPAYARMQPDSARRTFERDKAELLEAGIPLRIRQHLIDGVEERHLYSLETHDFFLPYLKLVEGAEAPREQRGLTKPGTLSLSSAHLTDALHALQRVADLPESPFAAPARSAFAKLALDLDDAGALEGAPVHIAEPPGSEASRALLGLLSDALIDRVSVHMRYRAASGGGEASERVVDPYGLMAQGGRWYLVAHDHGRDGIRQFRVDRIESAEPREAAAPFTVPADFSITTYAHRRAWELGSGGEQTEAVVRFAFPWSLWAERNGYGELITDEPDGAALRRFRVQRTEPFLRWLLSAEAELELIGPPTLAQELHALATAVAALYSDTHEEGEADGDHA